MAKFRIGLAVTGGIAAYKAVEVLRLLQKAGCDVQVAMTRHATEFVRPLTFRSLSEKHVIVDDYDPANPDPIAHINFSQNIDLLLIVPATANIIAKFAYGLADDFLSSTYLASTAPVMIAPAMNTTMWDSRATQRNVKRLRSDGVHFVEPIAGELACKTIGTGKLEDVENIVKQALGLLRIADGGLQISGGDGSESLSNGKVRTIDENPQSAIGDPESKDLAGERFLITVGGTREAIDPVRFISNHSSGKMGFAVAEAAAARGAKVTVVAGVTTVIPPAGIKIVDAVSAEDMHAAVKKALRNSTVFVGAAAVADYAPANAEGAKIKKDGREFMILELKKTPDILSEVSEKRPKGMLVVGFAAETNDVIGYARSKLKKKNLDMVVANDITKKGAGFNTDTNIATIITRSGGNIDLPLMSKREMANRILDEVIKLRSGVGSEPPA
jgi:phosphopantothenoylcysteine decarboxylase / phosphopantothenate---cysteine ligase